MSKNRLSARFWGVRGSIACPGADYARYGGNTSCIEVRCGQRLIVLDAGTGLRELGRKMGASKNCRDEGCSFDILLTHTHVDHITGIPFFGPLFDPQNKVNIRAGHLAPDKSLREVIKTFMADPLFPVPPEIFGAKVNFIDFLAGETIELDENIAVRTCKLNHPNGATGYRIDYEGRSLCYITDTEHPGEGRDQAIVNLIQAADLVIYDCSYTDEEYPRFKGWGHSTWQEGVRLADAADVGTLAIYHHDPAHDNAFMDAVAEEAESLRPGTFVAREGQVIDL